MSIHDSLKRPRDSSPSVFSRSPWSPTPTVWDVHTHSFWGLPIGRADSPCEEEADEVADLMLSEASSFPGISPLKAHARSGPPETGTTHFPTPVSERFLRHDGEALQPSLRSAFEPRLGMGLGGVRVHTDADAANAARELGASAFTIGSDISFGVGQFRPDAPSGRSLIAHELAHVVQQGADDASQAAPMVQCKRNPKAKTITTPLPGDAAVDPKSGKATMEVGGVKVIFVPDAIGRDPKPKTKFDFSYKYDAKPSQDGRRIESYSGVRVTVHIRTWWVPGITGASPSAYGRGTTSEDVASGNTSLSYHEGRHGTDYLDYIATHPCPRFQGQVGMSVEDFKAAGQRYKQEWTTYREALEAFSLQQTDCVGITIDDYNAAEGVLDPPQCR